MSLIEEFKKKYNEKYELDQELYKRYKKALEEYEKVKNKYINMLNDLKEKSFELWRKVEKVKKERLELEKELDFTKADKKELELEQINKELKKSKEREEIVKEIIENNTGEIKEKADELMKAIEGLRADAHSKYYNAHINFRERRQEYNEKLDKQIMELLTPLSDIINEYSNLRLKIRGY
ncbi:hypothetical protein DP125_06045 [Clostridium tetani]|uniref:Uncharacterized protein n=1 Tax=Clostridium tetani TaxID=1513 RepID=A0A4Q0VE08_CLOTA|nr:hypothetical protein [Clostridium tetani]CDI50303.1 hypothetical protein BN906_02319 [Clostridium tetani 12124569]KHO36208.1 hypothetical protein OR62_11255 [Clostridium tetani]RXI49122.1 hypothetical protein DP130_06850 [Clostridium tetani]RXI55919.1 hypothetical protein DP131_07690 [Clostridium tetani]RXI60150.1 hypothetical protein DP132_11700 [Clostridium tetani]